MIFSPITYDSLLSLSNNGSIDEIPLLASGFAILSNNHPTQGEERVGSIVTLSFQLLDSLSKARDIPKKSIRKLYNLVNGTLSSIRVALFENSEIANKDAAEGCTWPGKLNKHLDFSFSVLDWSQLF